MADYRGFYKGVRESNGVLAGGTAAGLFAGCCLGLAGMLASYIAGNGFWSHLQLYAGTFYGVDAMIGGAPSAIVGAAGLLAVSAVYGILFASLVRPDTSSGSALWGGMVFGVCVWVLRTFITLPIINEMMLERTALMPGTWFVQHLVFGAALAVTPTVKGYYSVRAITRRAERKEVLHR